MNDVAGYDYADLFEHAPAGYMQLDGSGCILRINRTGAAMLGWDSSWLHGKPFSRWVVNNDKQLFQAHQHRLLNCEHCVCPELRIKNRQGRSVSLRLESMRAAGDDDGAPCYRSIMIDISGEEQSARRLRRLQSQLTHVARVNTAGELATSLAHELNQPLGTVVLNCEAALRLLNSGQANDYEFAQALTQATEAASFASKVIRHLRDFLRKHDEQHKVCTLPALIRSVTTLIETDARDHDVDLQLDVEHGMPEIRVDPIQIEQVLVNLARNSIEAMSQHDAGGQNRMVIRARRSPPDQLMVSVADTGPGLDSQQIDRLFNPFYTTKRDGMGMGLSISRTIIEAHGGRLWIDRGTRQGATMHFTLPTLRGEDRAD